MVLSLSSMVLFTWTYYSVFASVEKQNDLDLRGGGLGPRSHQPVLQHQQPVMGPTGSLRL